MKNFAKLLCVLAIALAPTTGMAQRWHTHNHYYWHPTPLYYGYGGYYGGPIVVQPVGLVPLRNPYYFDNPFSCQFRGFAR